MSGSTDRVILADQRRDKERLEAEHGERFWGRTSQIGQCIEWQAGIQSNGYGVFYIESRSYLAHRVSYAMRVGPIPVGLQIDHICRNRKCVNPDHLRAVTPRVNSLAGISPAALNARKTHCKRGHEFTPENTAREARGRRCRKCGAEGKATARQAERDRLALEPPKPKFCKWGHEMTPENTLKAKLQNYCRECRRLRDVRYRAEKKARR